LADFLADKRKEAADKLLMFVSNQSLSVTSDTIPVVMAVEAPHISKSSSDALEKETFVAKFMEAPENHQRACVAAFIDKKREGNVFSLGNRGRSTNYFRFPVLT